MSNFNDKTDTGTCDICHKTTVPVAHVTSDVILDGIKTPVTEDLCIDCASQRYSRVLVQHMLHPFNVQH